MKCKIATRPNSQPSEKFFHHSVTRISKLAGRMVLITLVAITTARATQAQTAQADTIQCRKNVCLLSPVSAVRNDKTKTVLVSAGIKNMGDTKIKVHLSFAGVEDFSLTDQTGKVYKVFSYDGAQTLQGINDGYGQVTKVRFGDKAMSSFLYADQELSAGERKDVSFVINKISQGITQIKEMHVPYTLYINGIRKDEWMFITPQVNIATKAIVGH